MNGTRMLRTSSAQVTRLPAAASAYAMAGRDTTDKHGFLYPGKMLYFLVVSPWFDKWFR